MTVTLPIGTAEQTLARMFPQPSPWQRDVPRWMADRLGEYAWSKQREITDSVMEHRRTAVQSCHGPGKSHVASRIISWWLDPKVHPIGSAFVVSTAPSDAQVGAILWREIGKAHRKGNLEGRITLDKQWYMGQELVGYGRKPADYLDVEQAKAAFQGIHARYVLVVLDEAAGIPRWLWEAISGLETNEHARVLAIGNPDDPTSEFASKCAPGSGWNVVHISVFDTPNFTGEWVPDDLRDLLPSEQWAKERAAEWGEDSPLYIAKVLGQFPEVGDDTLIHPGWVRQAKERELAGLGLGRWAMDVARSGKDESVIGRMRDGVYRQEWHKVGVNDTTILQGHAISRTQPHHGAIPIVIDAIGIGAGVFDNVAAEGQPAVAFVASEKAAEPERYANRRAEQWWEVRRMFKDGEIDIEDDDKLAAQLQSLKWKLDKQGRIVIESKDDMKKRGMPSPDRADTLMMATVEDAPTLQQIDEPDEAAEMLTAGIMTRAM